MSDILEGSAPSRSGRFRVISRYVMPCTVVLLLCFGVAGSFWIRAACREASEAKQELLSSRSNTRQLLQQLYELANLYIEDLPDPTTLTTGQKKLLDTWVACDESFLRLNQNSPKLLLERSLVTRRAGTIRGLLGDYDRATRHLNESLSLLEQASQGQADQLSYQFLQLECQGLLAWTNANTKRRQDAVRACRNAATILDRLKFPDTAESDLSLVQAIHQVTHASLGLGELDLAYRFGQAEFAARSRLSARAPGDPVALEQLQQAKEFLDLVKSHGGSTDAF